MEANSSAESNEAMVSFRKVFGRGMFVSVHFWRRLHDALVLTGKEMTVNIGRHTQRGGKVGVRSAHMNHNPLSSRPFRISIPSYMTFLRD